MAERNRLVACFHNTGETIVNHELELEFSVESLESRKMMAGDVSVSVGGGDLRITGDSSSNEIRVSQVAIPDLGRGYRFEGVNGTTVNGQDVFVLHDASVVDDDIRINMRGGDNKVALIGPDEFGHDVPFSVAGDLMIRSGGGNDTIYVELVGVEGDVSIRTRGGEDAIVTNLETVGNRMQIQSGSGNDLVQITQLTAANQVMINLGSGDDTLMTAGVNVASDFDIKMGAGEDGMFAISSIFAAGLSLNGGSSADILVDKAAGGTTGSVDYRYRIDCE